MSYAAAFSVDAAIPGARSTSFCTYHSAVTPSHLIEDTTIGDQVAALGLHAIENADLQDFKYAILLNKAVEEVSELPLFRFIKEWIGVPYSFGGNGKEGIDCSGFVQRLVSTLYNLPISRMVKTQFEECLPILRHELREGDLLFFHTTRPGLSHVGYYLGNNKFVHASTVRGVIIDDLCDPYYDKAFRQGGRLLPRNEQPSISANE
jgi:lipoprotein Spr